MDRSLSPFPLTRLIATAGGVIVVAVALTLAWHIERASRATIFEAAEQSNVAITRGLASVLAQDIARVLAQPPPPSPASPAVEALQTRLKAIVRGLAIAKVKLYAPSGLTIFSSDPAQIGEDKSTNEGFRRARAGEVASLLVFRNQFDAFEGVIEDRDLLSSYVPVPGDVAPGAVIEIYQDVTPIIADVRSATHLQQAAVVAAFALVYVLVLAVAARAEARAARLAAAADRADRESRIKSDFLASMSHELRTPLNAVLGFVEILRSELFGPIDNPRYRGYLADIQRAAQHLLSVINDVLDLGRLEAGVARPEIAQVELDQVAESAVAMVRPQADAARIALNRAALAEGAPTIRSDGRLIRQILLNLLGNAVKFTPSGGSVSLSLEAADDAVRLVVADTGPGMTAEEVSTALAPYGQIERISARSAAGTGLGLPIAERLARILGGGLEIESALGTGTRVTVTLPRTPKAA